MLTSDLFSWNFIHYYFRKRSRDGTLEEINDVLRDRLRRKRRCKWSLSFDIADYQSVKTTRIGGEHRGIDVGKKLKDCKWHIIAYTRRLLLVIKVHAVNCHDSKTAFDVIFLAKVAI